VRFEPVKRDQLGPLTQLQFENSFIPPPAQGRGGYTVLARSTASTRLVMRTHGEGLLQRQGCGHDRVGSLSQSQRFKQVPSGSLVLQQPGGMR
jgi:hypothetical protein